MLLQMEDIHHRAGSAGQRNARFCHRTAREGVVARMWAAMAALTQPLDAVCAMLQHYRMAGEVEGGVVIGVLIQCTRCAADQVWIRTLPTTPTSALEPAHARMKSARLNVMELEEERIGHIGIRCGAWSILTLTAAAVAVAMLGAAEEAQVKDPNLPAAAEAAALLSLAALPRGPLHFPHGLHWTLKTA